MFFSTILTNKLLQLVERTSDTESTYSKYIVNDAESKTVFEKEDSLIQFQEVSQILVTSKKPLKHEPTDKDIPFVKIPDLYPVNYTITLPPEHFYDVTSKYRKFILCTSCLQLTFNILSK